MWDQLLSAGTSIAGKAISRPSAPRGPVISGSGRGAELNADGWTVSFGSSTATGATLRRSGAPAPLSVMPGELPGQASGVMTAGGGLLPWVVIAGLAVMLIKRRRA